MKPVSDGARDTAETVARAAYGRLLAYLSARSRDVAAAEDALAEAFRAALETWPERGVPDQPEAWLFTAAAANLIQAGRRATVRARGRADAGAAGRGTAGARAAELPRRAAQAPVRLRPSRDRPGGAGAADAADRAGARRRQDRLGLPGRAGGHGPAAGPRQDQDPRRRDRVFRPRAPRVARAARGGAGRDLRRLWQRLGGRGRRRRAAQGPGGGGDLAGTAGHRTAAGRARSTRAAGADALL